MCPKLREFRNHEQVSRIRDLPITAPHLQFRTKIDGMIKRRSGNIITPPGLFVDPHEKKTADYLAVAFGWDVVFLLPNRAQGQKTPDVLANKLEWEIKIPVGKSPRTIENIIRRALAQSSNIILDLRRMDGRIPTHRLLLRIEKRFNAEPFVKQIIVISRQETHVDFTR